MAGASADLSKLRSQGFVWLAALLIILAVQYWLNPPETSSTDLPEFYSAGYLALHKSVPANDSMQAQTAETSMYAIDVQQRTEHYFFPELKSQGRTIWFFHPPFAVP